MKPLGDDARSLIEAAADAYEPTLADKKRLRSDVGARIAAVGVGVGVVATTASVTAATVTTAKTAVTVATTGGIGFGTKVGAVMVVASAAVVGAWFATGEPKTTRDDRELPSTKVTERERMSVVAHGGQGTNGGTTPESRPPPEAPVVAATPPPAPTVVTRVVSAAPAAPKVVEEESPAPKPASGPTPESETTYIKKAETAIDTSDGIAALQALDDHRRVYPEGILAGRREVLRVIATCTVGRVAAAREQAEKYLAEHPRTTEAARIRRVCGTP